MNNDYINTKYDKIELKKNIVIYGTGTIAKKVYDVLTSKNYEIKYFLNRKGSYSNSIGNSINLKYIDSLEIKEVDKTDITVIIAIFNRDVDIKKIIRYVKDIGYKDIVTFLDVFDLYSDEFCDNYWLNSREKFIKDIDKILEVEKLFKDKKSIEVYNSIVNFRMTRKYYDLIEQDRIEEQYFAKDIENLYRRNNIRFVDCGAFDGDTIQLLCNNFSNINAIAAFEPDLINYKNMLKNTKKLNSKILEFIAIPNGVYCNSQQLKFSMNNSEGSNVSEEGTTIIQCVAIDECIRNFKPTHIKMDVEGCEYEGLLGAKETIMNNRPNLMICLYHRPEDLYTIPKLIESWNLGYKFYLRLYGNSGFELVLYCINEDQIVIDDCRMN